MNNIQNKLIVLLFIAIAIPYLGSSQDNLTFEPSYEVNRIYPFISISKEKLNEARTLTDLGNETNKLGHYYKSSWVREYISVEVLTSYKGKTRKAVSTNDTLSQEHDITKRYGQKGLGQRNLGRSIQLMLESSETNEGKCMFAYDVFKAIERAILDYVSEAKDRAKFLDDLKIAKGLYRERIMTEMPNVGFNDEVFRKQLLG